MIWEGFQADLATPGTPHPFLQHATPAAPQDPPEGLSMPSLEPLQAIDITAVTLEEKACLLDTR